METSIHTVDLFKIPDVNQRLKRRHRAPAFKTIFNKEFGLVRNQHQFLSRRINFIPRTYIVRPKTCYCQKQSSQDPIFPSHARDQSFTRVARIRRNTRRYWTRQTLPVVIIHNKNFPQGTPQKLYDNPHESQVHLIRYSENYRKL